MPKKPTIGMNNPFGGGVSKMIPTGPVETAPVKEEAAPQEPKPAAVKALKKERLTVHLPIDLIDRAKNAVYWTPGLTLAGLAEQAFNEALDKLEKEQGRGFDPRKEELKGGRPIKLS